MRRRFGALVVGGLAFSLACGGNATSAPVAAQTSEPQRQPEPDLAGTAQLRSATVLIPEGYNLDRAPSEESVVMQGKSGFILAVERPIDFADGLEACAGFASGFAHGTLAGIMGKKPEQITLEPASPAVFGDNGCRVPLAPAVGRPALFEIVVQKFGSQAVLVLCSIKDEPQAIACATVQESLTARN